MLSLDSGLESRSTHYTSQANSSRISAAWRRFTTQICTGPIHGMIKSPQGFWIFPTAPCQDSYTRYISKAELDHISSTWCRIATQIDPRPTHAMIKSPWAFWIFPTAPCQDRNIFQANQTNVATLCPKVLALSLPTDCLCKQTLDISTTPLA